MTLTAVTMGKFTEENVKRTVADPAKVSGLWLQPGDILIERSNTPELVGTARLFPGPPNYAIFPDLLIRVRVKPIVVARFVEIVLQAEPARRYFRSRAQGIAGSMPKIDQGTIERLPVAVPPLAEQLRNVAEVDRRLSLLDGLEAAITASHKRAGRLRQSILKRAFEGKLVPQDPDDEPAEALLARIGRGKGKPPRLLPGMESGTME